MESILNNDLDLLIPNDNDVYLVAYPKAGVTWLTEIVTAVYQQYASENPERSEEFVNAVRAHAFCDVCPLSRRSSSVSKSDIDFSSKLIGFDTNGNETFESDSEVRRRIISLHFPIRKMETVMPEAFSNRKVKLIYISRNPKDTAVSYYHFHCMNDALATPSSWEDFLNDFTQGNVRWGSWFEHVREWRKKYDAMKRSAGNNFLWLSYECLKKDLALNIRKICDLLGLSLSPKGLGVVVKKCTFASMKADPVRNHSRNEIFKGDFLRKGAVGDWEKHFTVYQSRNFDRVTRDELEEDYDTIMENLISGIVI